MYIIFDINHLSTTHLSYQYNLFSVPIKYTTWFILFITQNRYLFFLNQSAINLYVVLDIIFVKYTQCILKKITTFKLQAYVLKQQSLLLKKKR